MKVVAAAAIAAMLLTGANEPVNALTQDFSVKSLTMQLDDEGGVKQSNQAIVQKFHLYNSDLLDDYNKEFKMNMDNIQSITNNGGTIQDHHLKMPLMVI
ncbi:hypothetical protein [Paracerasibacillus soli]|uniref:Uncharacterized protein n=1 Tax=Paracerasibacillus soli TaxID=480284 RepID=A0ABU5CUN1_9BACI|nr:hypothetical protein [Virgibacillus soli]MDY0410089.1 hypothetical protein [Virgibacillus soli]